jgi:hypothetical protein
VLLIYFYWSKHVEGVEKSQVRLPACSFGWWLVLREKDCWLIISDWFVLREKYWWLYEKSVWRSIAPRGRSGSLRAVDLTDPAPAPYGLCFFSFHLSTSTGHLLLSPF